MRTVGKSLAVIAMALALLVAGPAQAASYARKQKLVPGHGIFNSNVVLDIRIEISTNELKQLQRSERQYVRATFQEGSNVWNDVGIRIKGAAGSTRGINDKPALTIGFGHFTPDQRFYGLRKFHLNNSVQDASYLCENIASELFRKADVPTPRVSYANVTINGRKRGLYVLKEGFAKEMLGLYFKNTEGNLYDGGFLQEVDSQLERDMGEEEDVNDWSDLKALAKAAQEKDIARRWEELSRVLDVDRFITFCTLEVMLWDWDGYMMNRNNYRVYHDLDTGRMVFFPHGMDQMFWEPGRPVWPQDKIGASIVGRAVLTTPQGEKLYRQRFGEVFTNVFQIEAMTNRVNELAALLKPHAGDAKAYDDQVKRIRDLITGRHRTLLLELSLPPPEPLKFESGVAKLANWELPGTIQALSEKGQSKRQKVTVDGRRMLHIQTAEASAGSWRTRVILDAGEYRFEAKVKTADVVSVPDPKKGEGAGIRHSGTQTPRENKLVGTSDWTLLTHTFPVQVSGQSVFLLCELRASAGEAWFDLDSLRLVKIK
jgi:spore coat protein H